MDTTNSQNRPNQNTFSSDPNVSDKHLDFVKQQKNTPQYINPNNFQKVLGSTPTQPTIANSASQPAVNQVSQPSPIRQAVVTPPAQQEIPQMQVEEHYAELKKETLAPKTANSHEVLKLALYVIPMIAIFVLLLKSSDDKEVLWHTRHSLVAQAIWFIVIVFLTILNAPIFSSTLLTLWRIGGYIILIYAGTQAYLGVRHKIPVAYDIGKNFIEGKN